MEQHGVSNESWLMSPISSSWNKTLLQHPDSKPFTKNLSLNSRASTDTTSSVSLLSYSLMFASPSPTAKSRKSHSRGLWKAMKQFLTCYNPVRTNPKSKQKSSKEDSVAASKASSIHSVRASPSPDHAYTAMNAEEREENLRAVITYCNKSMESGRRKDTMVKDCIRSGCRTSSRC
ncbi:hypothetical protein REPUB_Repub18cG0104000 [Reevesia pubescens]